MAASGRAWIVLLAGIFAAVLVESRTHLVDGNPALAGLFVALWAALLAVVIWTAEKDWTRRHLARLHRTEELTRLSLAPMDHDEYLLRALEQAAAWVHADAAAAFALEGQHGAVLRAVFNLDESALKEHVCVIGKDPLLRATLASREPRVLEVVDGAALPEALRPGNGSLVLVPLWNGTRAWGYLAAVSREVVTLSRETRGWLSLLSAQVATTLHNIHIYEELRRESRTDPLTGLASRRYFDETFRRELAMARRHHRPLSLAMIDVDRMKSINDDHGHPMGDEVLKTVGELLRESRCGDVAARYGGDEFLLLMPDTSVEQADRVIRRLRDRLQDLNRTNRFPFKLSLSIGVRQMGGPDTDLLTAADEAMYREKRERRMAASAHRAGPGERGFFPHGDGDEEDREMERLRRRE